MDNKRVQKLYYKAMDLYNETKYKSALTYARKIQRLGDNWFIAYTASGLLIDIGLVLNDENIVTEGVSLLENNLSAIINSKDHEASAYYNLANGYSALLTLKRRVNPEIVLFQNTEAEYCKKYYLKALEHVGIRPKNISEIYVNLGNTYDALGRVVEALDCYVLALKYLPNHGMAKANKAAALVFYSRLMDEHRGTILKEAYSLMKGAFRDGINPEARSYFENYISQIERAFKDKNALTQESEYPGITIKGRSKNEKMLIQFCLENKLYLNLCNHCQKCDAAVGDKVNIRKMFVKLKKNESLSNDKFLILSGYLNQIKQDFITARLLLTISLFRNINLNYVDKRVVLIDAYDYTTHNIYVQLLRTSYKLFYDILDKIAFFINDYLNLGISDKGINFTNVWYSNKKERIMRAKIVSTKNFSLNALFNIHTELSTGEHKILKEIRNMITHRFLKVKMFKGDGESDSIKENEFYDYTKQLATLVRSAIIYLLFFVDVEETKNENNSKGKTVPFFARAIEDKHKHY